MLLNEGELAELYRAALDSGVFLQRAELLAGIPQSIADALPVLKNRNEQVLSDLKFLNRIPALDSGTPAPLEIWLKNAIELSSGSPEQAVFYEMLQKLIERRPHKTKSAPPPASSPPGFSFLRPFMDFLSDPYKRFRALGGEKPTIDSEPLKPSQPAAGTEAAPTKTPERVVNTGFAPSDRPREPAARDQCLNPASNYYFWLEVGKVLEKSIERKPMALPAELLPENAELTVVLFANPNGFELDPEADLGKLKLENDGSVLVSQRACLPEGIEDGDAILNKRLFFPIKTPAKEGVYFLRLCIYFENALVQSRQITARVAKGRYTANALQSEVDYTLSRSLRAQGMEFLRGHRLSIFMNESEGGSHGFRFFGKGDYHNSLSLEEDELQNLINTLRNTLKKACWNEEADWTPARNQSYRYEEAIGFPELSEDLINMAKFGYRAYAALANRLGDGPAGAKQLRELMRQPGTIQFALKQSARLYLPIALFYDHKLDTWLEAKAYSLCEAFKQSVGESKALENTDCFQGNCPNRDSKNVVCPGGFWGFRHALGLPLTLGGHGQSTPPELQEALPRGQAPSMTISVCNDPNMQLIEPHIEAIKKLVAGDQLRLARTRDDAIHFLKAYSSHIVYFYCHGGVDRSVPFLQIGPEANDRFGADTLSLEEISWPSPRSLVFINGCHTTDLEPERAIDLVTGFVDTAMASGVIGTEITIFEPLAVDFAQWFFQFFLIENKSLGESIRLARLRLLQRQLNPLGLVYIPFAASTLQLC